jgi:hypothetical protein
MEKFYHYLVTLSIPPHSHLHAYFMFKKSLKKYKDAYTENVMNQMLDYTKKAGMRPLEVFLVTELSDGFEIVQSVLDNLFPEAERTYRVAKETHISVWGMPADHPDDKKLMALH